VPPAAAGSAISRIAIAGGHGQIALALSATLAARGDEVLGLIRNRDHGEDVRARGAEPVMCDLEHTDVPWIAEAIKRVDAVVFAAGAGPGSGAERKLTMDRDGAVKLIEAARSAGVPRYLMISSVGAESPPDGDDVFSVYLRAKAQADAALQASELDWTIVRPGRLTDDTGSGRVRLSEEPFRGQVPREDVAAVLAALVESRRASRRVLYVNSGQDPIATALERL
jgi:nucleoside-diphosphate-sugar epimerase